ncbi:undecaprenyl-diphosphatase [Modicisalibacter ilicicola DSM 19980]|uniref:Undecaprenyl-diphosphatase n=1 Tax=Modicisalibacter ilicicola DSM 19980 TaxID=1121942 RepID=A0A1M5BUV6_9GAMM|nr:bifunctional DedA family/phosphatase PAP2 family protein [Halomonas ilicicola]SHF46343.1 undecaprenyl-diphosphatase [Halomonas ilicicola DSM 19980]
MNATQWLQTLTPSPEWLLLFIAAISLVESLALIGLIVPGVVLLTAAASLAGHYDVPVFLVLTCAFLGAVIGDGLSFMLGHTQRQRIPSLWPFRQHPEWLARGARFFKRYGVLSVLVGRFVGPVRPVVPMIAGMMRMPRSHFLWSNLGSALLWAPAYLLPGYLLGKTWQQLLVMPPGSEGWLILLALAILALALMFSLLRHQLAREGRLYRGLAYLALGRPWWRWLWHALRSSRPSGEFPLASLTLLFVSLPALSGWTLWVLEQDGPLPMDQHLQSLVDALAGPMLIQIAAWMAEAGDTLGVIALVLPWALWLLFRHQHAVLLHLLGGLGGIALGNTLFKHLAGRVRPETPDYLVGSFSYPSAHTSTAVVLYGLAAAFVAETLPSRHRALAYWAAILICVPMALSRLVIGVHWLSDLIGGALLGLVACALVRVSYHRFAIRTLQKPPWITLSLSMLALLAARILWLPPV